MCIFLYSSFSVILVPFVLLALFVDAHYMIQTNNLDLEFSDSSP